MLVNELGLKLPNKLVIREIFRAMANVMGVVKQVIMSGFAQIIPFLMQLKIWLI
jgi:hypothetical protein